MDDGGRLACNPGFTGWVEIAMGLDLIMWASGNSLVYGIDVAEFSAYMLNYQHCYFYWTICAGKSA